tara:strand:- start:530 stop:844 length:315 start_codon:yes stop_codon:yes gene_type:complete
MSHFNSSKIIQEAIAVISSVEMSMKRQAGFKLGDPTTYGIKADPDKQAKVEKLTSLVHFASHLETENAKQFSTISDLLSKVRMLNHIANKLQHQIDVDKKLSEL